MPRRIAPPARLRRRIFVSFVLVAGVSGAALAVGSFLLVRQSRLDDSVDRSVRQARLNIAFARQNPPDDLRGLLDFYGNGAGFDTVIVAGGEVRASSLPGLFRPPEDLARIVRSGQIGSERMDVPGRGASLVVGGRVPGRATDLYFIFAERTLQRDLRQLALVLTGGWVLAVAVAAATGLLLARRTLGPVARASRAARDLAEGLLDTRLPVETRDEFGAWATSFNEMASALEAKIEALSEARERERRFTSDVAHELRTPLSAVVGEASLLREHLAELPAEVRRPAELLVGDVGRLRRLVEELMEISRFDAGRETVQADPVEILPLVAAVLRARGWDGRVVVDGDGLVLSTDRRRLERIVANLVGNALEHGGRQVRVRVGRDGRGAFVEVDDAGPGIPGEHIPYLFDRFYKADPSRSGTGSGLGLAIAMENARLLGGDIEVRSELGVGSQFRLVLPVTELLQAGERLVAEDEDHEAREPHP